MAIINGTNGADTITPGLISFGVSGFPTAGDDTINGLDGNDTINGGAGNDILEGDAGYSNVAGSWNDFLDGGAGNDILRGYDGNDTYVVDSAGDDIQEEITDATGGVDTVRSSKINTDLSSDFTVTELENLVLIGNALNGVGNSQNNVITGNSRANSLTGGAGDDTILGGSNNDIVDGDSGNDIVRGQAGNDVVMGGSGVDTRIGGLGNDTFPFQFLTPGEIDTIAAGDGATAFQGAGAAVGDIIDLSGIDAVAGGGNNAFHFGGAAIGRLTLVNVGNVTQVRGNVDADATFELVINIQDGAVGAGAYNGADFIL